MSSAIEIWEAAILPFLLNSAETWISLGKVGINILNEIHDQFLWKILKISKSCPKPLMYFDLGQKLMKYRVMKKKLLFVHHLSQLEKDSIPFLLYNEQKLKNLPGLLFEVKDMLNNLSMTLSMMEKYTKKQWKTYVSGEIDRLNETEILEMTKTYKKIDYNVLKDEQCVIQDYMMNLKYDDAILKFRLRADMVQTVKCHWKNDPQYEADGWSCWHCPATDQTTHIQQCSEYANMRKD